MFGAADLQAPRPTMKPALVSTPRADLLGLLREATSRLSSHVASLQSSLEPLLRQKPVLLVGAAAGFMVIWQVSRRLTRLHLERRPPPPQLYGLDAFHRVVVGTGINPAPRGSHETTGHPPMQVVLTGGPLGGKSSLAAHLVVELQQRDVAVFVAPSVAALFLNSGCHLPGAADAHGLLQFECAVLQLQLQLEASFQRIAAASRHERCVIIYDRGVLDVAAFLPRELWGSLHEMAPQQQRPIDCALRRASNSHTHRPAPPIHPTRPHRCASRVDLPP